MTKEDEIQLVARTLAREKKKDSQIDRLKQLLALLKKKHDQAAAELKEKANGQQAVYPEELEEENKLLIQQILALKQSLKEIQKKQVGALSPKEAQLQIEQQCASLQRELDLSKNAQKLLEARLQESENRRLTGEKQNVQSAQTIETLQTSVNQLTHNESSEVTQLRHNQVEMARELQMFEKSARLLQEKESRTAELQQFEALTRQLSDEKLQLEQALEKEKDEFRQFALSKGDQDHSFLESKKHAEQLERVIQFLRERSEGANLELLQLRADFQNLQTDFDQCDDQLKAARTENEQLEAGLQSERKKKKEAEEESSAQQKQIQDLQHDLAASRLELKKEHEQSRRLATLEQELARIKQTLIRALRESQELEAHYQSVAEEKISLIGKCRQMQYQLDKEREQQGNLLDRLEAEASGNTELREQVAFWQQECDKSKQEAAAHLEAQLAKFEKQSVLVHQREETILDLQRQVGLLRHEGEKARDELMGITSAIVAKEKELQEAQQHLARKVKEVAEWEMRFDGKQKYTEELQQIIQESKVRIAELQTSSEIHENQQMRLQEQLQEAVKAYEGQQAKWENKYLAVYEKWQAAESRVKELERMEERYKQIQGLMGNYSNSPAKIPESAKVHPEEVKKEPEPSKETPEPSKKPFSNLFDLPKSTTHRQNLL